MCIFFTVETDDMSFEVYNNQSIVSGGGAGIESFIGNTGILREVLQKYKNGR
jgi:hypothetical protein